MIRTHVLTFMSLALSATAALAQQSDGNGEFQTGIDNIVIQTLEDPAPEDVGGFVDTPSGDLSLEDLEGLPDLGFVTEMARIRNEVQDEVALATGARLRALDRLNGEVGDLALKVGETAEFGNMVVTLNECRYPVSNPSGDAYAHLTLVIKQAEEPNFNGWMVASSPALSAMDDPRYDLWPLECNIADAETAAPESAS